MKTSVKNMKPFYRVYITVCAILVALLIVTLIVLGSVLSSYENTRAVHVAEEYFNKYFQKGDFCDAIELADYSFGEFETADDVSDYIKTIAEGRELTYYSVSSSENEECYAIVAAEKPSMSEQTSSSTDVTGVSSKKIATLTLKKSSKPDLWGFYPYSFENLRLDISGNYSIEFKVPSTSKVSFNGKTVSEGYITAIEESDLNDLLPDGVKGITYNIYNIGGLHLKPSEKNLQASDFNGKAHSFTLDEQTKVYSANLNYSEQLKSQYSQFVLEGMEEYAAFMQDDGSISKVGKYFDRTSLFYQNTRLNPGHWVRDHNGYRFENESVDEFYAYDENTFSCHVKITHVLKKAGMEEYRDYLDMIVFLRKCSDGFRIYNHKVL